MLRSISIPVSLYICLLFAACWGHKEQFYTTVLNQSAVALHSIEVDYPGGSYGIANLPARASNQKWIFASGSCRYSVRFVDEHGRQFSSKPIDLTKDKCPPGVTITIDAAMNVSAAATP
jgi:hypothetical protein